MTPCEKLGYKVGDKFEVLNGSNGFEKGHVVTLFKDDGSDTPLFKGVNNRFKHADGAGGAYMTLGSDVKPVSQRAVKPISKSKCQLAQLLIEAGVTQFPEDANWAAQDDDKDVDFFEAKPVRELSWWQGDYDYENRVSLSVKIPNWHQTVLSRDEFDQIVAKTAVRSESDADGWIEWSGGECPVGEDDRIDVKFSDGDTLFDVDSDWDWGDDVDMCNIIAYRLHKPEQAEPQHCESVTRSIPEPVATPTLDQLLQDWRNADDYAQRKQTEADEAAAMRDERWQAVQARAGEMGVTVGRLDGVNQSSDWIEWKGGEQPVEDGTLIDIKFRDGMEMSAAPAGVTTDDFPRHTLDWLHDDRRDDIVAYRLTRP